MIGCIAINLYVDIANCIYENIIFKPNINQKECKFVWFGDIGKHITFISTHLIPKGIKINYIADNNVEKWGKTAQNGALILSPERIFKEHGETAVFLVSSRHECDMIKQLHDLDVNNEQIIILPTLDCFEKSNSILRSNLLGLKQMSH